MTSPPVFSSGPLSSGLGRESAAARTLEMIASLRARLPALRDELDVIRRGAADLDHDTAWRARAARGYRDRLADWRARTDDASARIERLDDELRHVQARLVMGGP
ncbi:hypothetical protein [Microbacterium plantarum]|uniref:Uncharacterized protein n=1 Tax=Microbacterium plantarum TaxID=1816425 RepID=A0ABV5ENH1_9MICO